MKKSTSKVGCFTKTAEILCNAGLPKISPNIKDIHNCGVKGLLISKCPCGVFKPTKKPTNFFKGFLP